MKKTIIMALMAVASVSANAQQKQTIEIPSWLSNVKLSGYGMPSISTTDRKMLNPTHSTSVWRVSLSKVA